MEKLKRSSASGSSRKFAAGNAGGRLFLRLAGAFHSRDEPPRHLHLSAVEPGADFNMWWLWLTGRLSGELRSQITADISAPSTHPSIASLGQVLLGVLVMGIPPATRCCTATAAGGVDGAGRSFRCPAPHRPGSYPCIRALPRSCRPPCGRRRHSHCRNACPRAFSHCPWPAPLHGRHRQGSFRRW